MSTHKLPIIYKNNKKTKNAASKEQASRMNKINITTITKKKKIIKKKHAGTDKYFQSLPTKEHSKYTHTNMLINNLINKHNISLKQAGGVLGIDYVIFKMKMKKINKFITMLNKINVSIDKDNVSYKNMLNIFKTRAIDKASKLTELLDNYRQKTILNIYEQYELVNSNIQSSATDDKKAQESLKTVETHISKLITDCKSIDNSVGDDMPEFERLDKLFIKNKKEFNKLTEAISKEAKFITKITELQRDYDINKASVTDKKKLSKRARNKVIQFEKHKSEYMKVIKLNDTELQTLTNILNELNITIEDIKYYKSQFGEYEGTKKIEDTGELDTQMYNVDCESGGLLCVWEQKNTDFAENLFNIISKCKVCKDKIDNIFVCSQKCVDILAPIVIEKDLNKQSPHALAMIRMTDDIKDQKSLIDTINKALDMFKKLFYTQKPAAQLLPNYNELLATLNYIEIRLYAYFKIFNDILEIKESVSLKGGSTRASTPAAGTGATSASTGTGTGTTSTGTTGTGTLAKGTPPATGAPPVAVTTLPLATGTGATSTKTASAKTADKPKTEKEKAEDAAKAAKKIAIQEAKANEEIKANRKPPSTSDIQKFRTQLESNPAFFKFSDYKDLYKIIEEITELIVKIDTLKQEKTDTLLQHDITQINIIAYNIIFNETRKKYDEIKKTLEKSTAPHSGGALKDDIDDDIEKFTKYKDTLEALSKIIPNIIDKIALKISESLSTDSKSDNKSEKADKSEKTEKEIYNSKFENIIKSINMNSIFTKENIDNECTDDKIEDIKKIIEQSIDNGIKNSTVKKQVEIDYNIIKNILRRFKDNTDYARYTIEKDNITQEFTKIKKALSYLVEDQKHNPIKLMANLIRSLVNILGDIETVETKIIKIEVKQNKAVESPQVDWIVKKADPNFDRTALSITKELEALRTKNADIQKIYLDSDIIPIEIKDLIAKLRNISDKEKDNNEIKKLINDFEIDSEPAKTQVNTLTKLKELKTLIKAVTTQYVPPVDKSKGNGNSVGCLIIRNINKIHKAFQDHASSTSSPIQIETGISTALLEAEQLYGNCTNINKENKSKEEEKKKVIADLLKDSSDA